MPYFPLLPGQPQGPNLSRWVQFLLPFHPPHSVNENHTYHVPTQNPNLKAHPTSKPSSPCAQKLHPPGSVLTGHLQASPGLGDLAGHSPPQVLTSLQPSPSSANLLFMNLFILCLPQQKASFLRAGTLSVLFSYAARPRAVYLRSDWMGEWMVCQIFLCPRQPQWKVTVDKGIQNKKYAESMLAR